MKHRQRTKYSPRFYKEVVMAFLALASIFSVLYEYIAQPTEQVVFLLDRFDIVVALIFLVDFLNMFVHAQNKGKFMRGNWYLLLASIPIVDSWAELLRGLRLLELLRLVRASEHLNQAVNNSKSRR